MLDLAWSEILIIGVVALVVVGPKDLPVVLRASGRWINKARGMAREFQANVEEMLREAEIDDLKKSMNDLGSINPMATFNKPFEVAPPPGSTLPEPVAEILAEAAPEPPPLDPKLAEGVDADSHPTPKSGTAA